MKTIHKPILFALLATLCGWTLNAATWYVNAANYNESYADAAAYTSAGHDGSEAAKGFGTIQVAIDQAKSGDTIYVEPGVYSNGTTTATTSRGASRIGWNNKVLYIYSTGDASNTHIVGKKSSETESGVGTDAVRCLMIYDMNGTKCSGTILKGFTFRDGATTTTSGGSDFLRRGGGACLGYDNVYFVDCVFSGCSSQNNGAAAYNGIFVRCLFTRNTSVTSSMSAIVCGSSSARAQLYACVFHHNAYGTANDNSSGTMLSYVTAVNCTILDNAFKVCCGSANESFYNTIFYNSGTYSANSAFANCVKEGDEPWPVMSTIIPDVRLLPGSAARMAGDGSHLSVITLPEGIDYKDYGGNLPASSGVIAAGATQTVGTPAAGGIAVMGGATCVNGTGRCRSGSYSYVFPDVYPTQYVFTAVAPEGKRLSYFKFDGNPLFSSDYRFPDRNDRLLVMPPADPNVVITNSDTVVWDVAYVKPDANAALADGSFEHPYRTLQAAYNANPSTVIVAMPGTYAEGMTNDTKYGRSRLCLLSSVTRITSEEGAEKTIIMGEADTSGDVDAYGRGPNAVRCIVGINSKAQVQGFTLTGGRTAKTDSGNHKTVGSVVRCTNSNPYFYLDDCIVTNNSSKESGVVVNARMSRCYVADNPGCVSFVAGGSACGCVFATRSDGAPSTGVLGSGRILHSTVIGEKATGVKPYGTSSSRYASVFLGGDTAGGSGVSAGNICWDFLTIDDAEALVADPFLADPANGDLHPFAASPVFGAGVVPAAANYGNEYWHYVTTDYEGNPITFNGGKPVVGAFMKPTTRRLVALTATNGGISPSAARVELAEDGTCMLTVADGTRPVAGVTVNGVTNLATSAAWSLALSGADAAGGMVVDAIYTNVWYVAPNGSDAATGFFPDAAKSLQGALSNATLVAGDRVVALPGTYRTGKMIQEGDYALYSRAVVPGGVTLESRDGKNATIIEGAQASVKDDAPSSYDVKGLGADAVRCVLLQSGASLKGFTLTNGWTRATKDGAVNHSDADTCGGGVWCAGTECRVEDCFMTGNGAYRGAGAFNGFCLNCEFADNYAYYGGGASSNCRNHGCLSHGNTAATWNVNSGIFAVRDAVNCTCYDSLAQGVSAAAFLGVTNTVVTGAFFPNNMAAGKVSHSVFNVDSLNSVPEGYFDSTEASFATNVMALAFDESGRPEIGKNCCVDAGTLNVPDTLDATDLLAGQRVYNGRLDIGAVEADWRGRYGRDICSRLSVQFASSQIVEMPDKAVRVSEGASLNATLQRKSEPTYRAKFVFRVSSGGVARLTVDGVETILQEGTHDFTMSAGDSPLPIDITAESGFVDVLRAQSLIGCIISVF